MLGTLRTVTRARLSPGARYRTLRPFFGEPAGALVTYIGFEEFDNHHGVERFTASDGRTIEVAGDSYARRGPLEEAARGLAFEPS